MLAKAGDSVRVTRKALFSAARTLKESSGLDLTGTITGLLNEYSEDDLVFRAR